MAKVTQQTEEKNKNVKGLKEVEKLITKVDPKTGRVRFDDYNPVVERPSMIGHQHRSFNWLVQDGLGELLEEVNPIEDFNGEKLSLKILGYEFEEPKISSDEARAEGSSYEASLYCQVELTNKVTGEVKKQKIYFGDYPWMTDTASFIVNGTERVVVSQLIRSPGVFFTSTPALTGNLFGAKLMPARGSWMEFETAQNGAIFVKIDRKRKLPVTTLLRAFGFTSDKRIKELFKHVNDGKVDYISATLDKDTTKTAPEALIEVCRKIRPGDLATIENAKSLIDNMFFNFKRFDFSRVGRFKINQRLDLDVENTIENRVLRIEDLTSIIAEIIRLNNVQGEPDDIDSLDNRRVKLVGELLQRNYRIGLLRMERNIRDRMALSDVETVTPQSLINPRPMVASVKDFFASSQLSQFMDQTNPLSELGHKRRLSSYGPGGLSRERAGFEVRDAHATHYGRVCVAETPDGPNVGLVLNMASHARINDYGFLETPYRKVVNEVASAKSVGETTASDIDDKDGKVVLRVGVKITKADADKLKKANIKSVRVKARVTDEVAWLDAGQEKDVTIAGSGNELDKDGYFIAARVEARVGGSAGEADSDTVDYIDAVNNQILGVSASLVPFVENNYIVRSQVGSNQQRQAVPLINPKAPIVATGFESVVAHESGQLVVADDDGTVQYADANEIKIKYKDHVRTYKPMHFVRSNSGTSLNQTVIVSTGQKLKKGDPIMQGSSVAGGELALGRDLRVAFMSWDGYNFEDAIVVSRRLVEDDDLTSVHISEFNVEIRETKLGPEQTTRDIPNASEGSLRYLDEDGIIAIGSEVNGGDVLVGKITPKGEQELSSEERLLRAIFGEKAKEVRDTSLKVPGGKHGKIVGVKVFSRAQGHELKSGVLKQVQVFIAETRKVAVGDKLGGRYGNKGVIAKILPEEDMPFTEDGEPVDIILSPLGVATRMNMGQLFETNISQALKPLGMNVEEPSYYGQSFENVQDILEATGFDRDGKQQLFDGRTGEAYDERVTIGYMHVIKLSHMIADKMHARSIGPYTTVTQQPLGGKAQNGGQRFGEMEVWALEAYGAANTLQEMLTIKSDDITGRSKAYESIIKQEPILGPELPESFRVLVRELRGLALNVVLMNMVSGELIPADNEVQMLETYSQIPHRRNLSRIDDDIARQASESSGGAETKMDVEAAIDIDEQAKAMIAADIEVVEAAEEPTLKQDTNESEDK